MVGILGLTLALQLALSGATGEVLPPALEPAPFAGAAGVPALLRQGGPNDVLVFSAARAPAPAPAFPVYYSYRSEEWVSLVADRLNLRDAGVTHLALWVASWPVRLDASETRLCLRVTLPMP